MDETLQKGTGPHDLGKMDIVLDSSGKIPGSGNAPSALDFDFKPQTKTEPKKKAGSGSRMGLVVAIVVALVVLVVAVTAGPGIIKNMSGGDETPPPLQYVNKAPGILERGGPAVDALDAAVEAISMEDSAVNRRIAEDAVAALEKEVRALLNAPSFDAAKVTQAANLAQRGVDLYPNEATRRLQDEAKEDDRAYKMMLTNIDRPTDTATFKLVGPGSPEVKVQEKDLLANRFHVKSIVGSKWVNLTDTKRDGRPVQYEMGSIEPKAVD